VQVREWDTHAPVPASRCAPTADGVAAQGGANLSRLAINYFYKDDLHLSPAEASFATGFTMVMP
jgi:hypothetical protein